MSARPGRGLLVRRPHQLPIDPPSRMPSPVAVLGARPRHGIYFEFKLILARMTKYRRCVRDTVDMSSIMFGVAPLLGWVGHADGIHLLVRCPKEFANLGATTRRFRGLPCQITMFRSSERCTNAPQYLAQPRPPCRRRCVHQDGARAQCKPRPRRRVRSGTRCRRGDLRGYVELDPAARPPD